MKNLLNNLLIIGLIESLKWLGSGTISRISSERIPRFRKYATRAADERLNQLNFQWQSLRFGMAKEIATHS